MKKLKSVLIISPILLTLLFSIFAFNNDKTKDVDFLPKNTMQQDTTFDVDAALAALREKIKGRENEPAEDVYENIEILNKMPAGRFLNIMQRAFNNSLGVSCNHCHNPESWESDEKPTKQITRDMWKMVGTINQELLANIENLQSERPAVNCTVCHRGEIKPSFSIK